MAKLFVSDLDHYFPNDCLTLQGLQSPGRMVELVCLPYKWLDVALLDKPNKLFRGFSTP
jgi:hypothetical protein